MALGRPSILADLMAKYGKTQQELVSGYIGGSTDEKDRKNAEVLLDTVLDYRNCNPEIISKFLAHIGADEAECEACLADYELFRKEHKPELDKIWKEGSEKNRKAYEEAQRHLADVEYDPVVKDRIEKEVYGKGLEWKKAKEAEKASKPKKEKKAKDETVTEVVTESPVEETVEDPFKMI